LFAKVEICSTKLLMIAHFKVAVANAGHCLQWSYDYE